MEWESINIEELLALRDQQHEATTTANAGPYVHPIGGMLRRTVPGMTSCDGDKECAVHHAAWADLMGK